MRPLANWAGYCDEAALDGGPSRLAATLFRIDRDETTEIEFHIPEDRHLICVHVAGSIDWSMQSDDRRWHRSCLPDTLCLGRAGETVRAIYRDAHARFVHFYVPTDLIESHLEAIGRNAGEFVLFDPANRTDRSIGQIARRTTQLMRSGPGARLLFDAAGLILIDHLLRRWSNVREVKGQRTPPTDCDQRDWRLRRAIEYLEARIGEDIGLREVATIVGLTTTHLTTLFRAGTGETPHRWLMRRRLERACEMLADPCISITDVALACGFASSQHLATVFQKRVGMTPSAYRRSRM